MARQFTELARKEPYHTIERTMDSQRDGKTVTDAFQYDKILPEHFKQVVATVDAETLADIYESYWYGLDMRSRGKSRQQEAQETSVVKQGNREIDLLTLPIPLFVKSFNTKLANVESEIALAVAGGAKKEDLKGPKFTVPAAVRYTARIHVEEKRARFKEDGTLVELPNKK